MVIMNNSMDVVRTARRPVSHTALVRVKDGLALRRIGRRHRVFARVFARSLDAQLAGGQAPEDRWLRSVRATVLSGPVFRQRLAGAWAHVLARAEGAERRPLAGIGARGADTRGGRELIAALIDILQSPGSASARGVAMATELLTDGTGPLYRPRSIEHLSAAVAATIRSLQPSEPLATQRPKAGPATAGSHSPRFDKAIELAGNTAETA